MADDIVVGSVAVDIVPDTKRFRRDLNAKLQGISVDVGINADTTGIRAELDEVTRKRDMTITANADVAEANAQLDLTARDRTSTIRANVDSSQVAAVGSLNRGLGGISTLATGLITLGPALIPILAALAGVGLALGAPLAIAGGGATVFGFLAGFAVKDTNAQLKAIDKQREKLAGLTKGTKEYAQAQDDLRVLTSGLSPAQKKFSDALDHIKGSFATLLTGKVGDQLLTPVTTFLNVTADTLPKLAPIIGAVSDALSTLLGDLGKAVKGPDFRAFIDAFSKQVGPDIVAFGRIAGHVFRGVASLAISLGDAFGPGLLKGIEKLTGDFADWAGQAKNSQKLQDFVDYFHRVGPQVGDTIQAVARGVGHVVTALAPLGPPALKVIEGIADAISGIPIPVLTGLATATAGIVAVSKLTKVGGSISGLLGRATGGTFGTRGNTPATPLYVFSVNGGGALPGGGGKTGGLVGKAGTLLVGLSVAEALNESLEPIFKKEYGDTLGQTIADTIRAATHLPDPELKGAGVKIAQGFYDYFFSKKPSKPSPLGPVSPQDVQRGIDLRREDIPKIRSTTDHVDGLKASLARASRQIDLIGPHADNAFGRASRDVADFSKKLDAIKDKKLKILLDDLDAVQDLRDLQAFRLKDKTLTIHVEQERDRVVGPGGGIGHPLGGGSSGGASRGLQAAPRTSRSSGRDAPLVNVENLQAHDYNDFLRQSQNRVISRGGGGVLLQGAV